MTKKLFTLFMLILLAIPLVWGTDVTFTAGEDVSSTKSISKDGITISVTDGNLSTAEYRCFKNQTMTISSTVGDITNVKFTCTAEGQSKYGPGCFSKLNTQPGSYSWEGAIGTWTGSAPEFSLLASLDQVRMTEIVVTIGGAAPPTPTVVAPVFDPASGTFTNSATIEITTTTSGAKIYYTSTTTGSLDDLADPTAESTEYTGAITINESTKFKAIAIKDNVSSDIITAEYTINAPVTNSLPFVETFDKSNGKGGNDKDGDGGPFGGNGVGNGDIEYDNDGWTGNSIKAGYKCAKAGSSSAIGNMTTPTITGLTVGSTYTITFKAAPWAEDDAAVMSVTASGGTISGLPTTAMTAGKWNNFELTFTASETSTTISFTVTGEKRFWLDEVNVTEQSTTGPKYYLVGDFNGWANAITSTSPSYKFHENNGTYTLTVQDLPACEFKIIRSDNGTSAAEWYGVINGQEANIHHNHHTGIGVTHDNGGNFRLQSAGTTSFSFQVNGGDPFNLTVTRDPILYIQGFDDWNNNVAMTQTSTGWTIPKTIAQGQEFRFVDEFGQQQGWNGGNYYINGINGSIDIKPGENVFVMNLSGDFVLNVNEGITTLNINEVDLKNVYTLVQHENDLVAGGEYIIAGGSANEPYTRLMGAVSSSNYGDAVSNGFTYDASAKTMTLSDDCKAQVLTLGGSAGAWTFYTGTKYLSLTSSSNNLNTSDNANNDNAKWTIDVDKMPLSKNLIANNAYTDRYLQYNSGSPRFACYTTSQQAVALFKRVAQSNKSDMPTITPGSGDVYGLSQQVEITQANGGAIYYTLDGTTPTENSTPYNGAFTVPATQFGQVITVTAIAIENGKEASHPVSATYKFIAPKKWTLKQIEAPSNPTGATYIVDEPLQVVYIDTDKEFAIARDMGENSSIAAVYCPDGATDFMRDVVHNVNDHQNGPWQQNNWVMLDFTDENANVTDVKKNGIIQGESLTGVYTDKDNYTIKVSGRLTQQCVDGDEYEPNVYSPANFHSSNTQTIGGTTYWFMTPKVMEVCKFTWAMYYNDPTNGYPAGLYMQDGEVPLKGGVGIDLSYNSASPTLVNGESYRFNGVIMKAVSGKKDPNTNPEDHYPQDGSTLNPYFNVAATNLTKADGQVITAVNEVKTGCEVVSVTYCDLAGRMSQKPFAGVNIIVTRYSDGSTTTQKVIR